MITGLLEAKSLSKADPMTDDIVTRLRVSTVADSAESIYEIMTEAADEIERLRYELIQANNQIKLLIAIETSGKDS